MVHRLGMGLVGIKYESLKLYLHKNGSIWIIKMVYLGVSKPDPTHDNGSLSCIINSINIDRENNVYRMNEHKPKSLGVKIENLKSPIHHSLG